MPQGHGHQLTLTLGDVRAIDQLTGLSESVGHRPHHGLMATHASHIGMVPEAAKPEDITETSGSSPDCVCQASVWTGATTWTINPTCPLVVMPDSDFPSRKSNSESEPLFISAGFPQFPKPRESILHPVGLRFPS